MVVGDTVELEVQYKGNPPPQIGWKKGSDSVIPNDTRIILEHDEASMSQKLTIHNLTKSDTAWYTCSAVNRSGIASCTCKVDVLEEWETDNRIVGPGTGSSSKKLNSIEKKEDPKTKIPFVPSNIAHFGQDEYDEPHLIVQKSHRLGHISADMREALKSAYMAESAGTFSSFAQPDEYEG